MEGFWPLAGGSLYFHIFHLLRGGVGGTSGFLVNWVFVLVFLNYYYCLRSCYLVGGNRKIRGRGMSLGCDGAQGPEDRYFFLLKPRRKNCRTTLCAKYGSIPGVGFA